MQIQQSITIRLSTALEYVTQGEEYDEAVVEDSSCSSGASYVHQEQTS